MVGSYVDWVEQTGAAAALIPFDMPFEVMVKILKQTQGMVLPGGAVELVHFKQKSRTTPYQDKLHKILAWTRRYNDAGNYYPVWGTCLGMEELLISFNKNGGDALEDGFDDHKGYHAVKLNKDFWKSKFFSN